MKPELYSFWSRLFNPSWKFGLVLVLIVCVPRFILVLQANQTGNYSLIGAVMLVSALLPFIFLNRSGLQQIGIKKTNKLQALVCAFMLGLGISFILHFIGLGLYDTSLENWYVYIGKSYGIPEDISTDNRKIMFLIMAITGMTFSPIGEEFFFRGIVHGCFAESIGEKKASIIDSLAFAVTHISHFGLVYASGEWDYYAVPGLIWVVSMFAISMLFIRMKRWSGSLWGAVLCHSGFNMGMIYCIFYLL